VHHIEQSKRGSSFLVKPLDRGCYAWYKPHIENGYQNHFMPKKPIEHLSEYLVDRGLKSTSQRDKILDIFVKAGRHLSAEELYARVKKSHPGIGFATVYRTLKLLAEAGLAQERRFEGGFTRYEHASPDAHHDHLICTRCGAIIEFENERIEELQRDVARMNRFTVQNHKLELYGLCEICQGKKNGARSSKSEVTNP
jgi:Fur family transcriptional regulator, ferric uptake regulator